MPVSRIPLIMLFLGFAVSPPILAQPARKPADDKFAAYRLDARQTGEQSNKVNQMKNGSVNLDPPAAEDKAALLEVARNYVYPVTHQEYYFTPDGPELVAKAGDTRSPAVVVRTFRAQLLIASPTSTTTQLAYIREFGAAAVKAIDEVLAKSPPPVIRINALQLLVAAAESGAPAAFDRAVSLLQKKDDPNNPLDVLYYALNAAEGALGAYDPARGVKWTNKNKHYELVCLVDDVVQKVPAGVLEKTYIPDKPVGEASLTTDPKAKPPEGSLTPEQVDVAQMFRLQAIRALAKVRIDVVTNDTQDKERRPLYTLCRVAVSDPSLVPAPSVKELGEAVIGLGTMVPSESVNADVLGLVIAKGVSDFILEKAAAGKALSEGEVQRLHWKVYGNRLKNAYTTWERDVQKTKLPKAAKDTLTGIAQTSTTAVFEPLTRQTDKGAVTLDKAAVDNWYTNRFNAIQAKGAFDLYTDKPDYKVTGSRR